MSDNLCRKQLKKIEIEKSVILSHFEKTTWNLLFEKPQSSNKSEIIPTRNGI